VTNLIVIHDTLKNQKYLSWIKFRWQDTSMKLNLNAIIKARILNPTTRFVGSKQQNLNPTNTCASTVHVCTKKKDCYVKDIPIIPLYMWKKP
jgi:hypothetical protein